MGNFPYFHANFQVLIFTALQRPYFLPALLQEGTPHTPFPYTLLPPAYSRSILIKIGLNSGKIGKFCRKIWPFFRPNMTRKSGSLKFATYPKPVLGFSQFHPKKVTFRKMPKIDKTLYWDRAKCHTPEAWDVLLK